MNKEPTSELPIVVTIDGPAGAGKSTVARRLARRLGVRYLDTGAMYRSVTLAALEAGLALDDGPALGRLAESLALHLESDGRTLIGDRDVSALIREERVSAAVSEVSAQPEVRAAMTGLQRRIGEEAPLVCEGRDMGTVVFPEAELKVYLDADARTRAQRRRQDLEAQGEAVSLEELIERIERRDRYDSGRAAAPLRRDDSQLYLDTSSLSIDQVMDRLEELVAERIGHGAGGA